MPRVKKSRMSGTSGTSGRKNRITSRKKTIERTNQSHFKTDFDCSSEMYVSPKWIKEPSLSCLAPWIIQDLFEPAEKLLQKELEHQWNDFDFSIHSATGICVGPLRKRLEAISNEMNDEFKTFNIWFTLRHIKTSPFIGVVVKNKKNVISYDFMNLERILYSGVSKK